MIVAFFSASGFFVQMPWGPRKSGMPESVEIPAPVSTMMRWADATSEPASADPLVVHRLSIAALDGLEKHESA